MKYLAVTREKSLLEIKISVIWEESERSWFGVIQQYDEACEPDSNGLTNCTESDFEDYIIAGGSNADGKLQALMMPQTPKGLLYVKSSLSGSSELTV